MVFPHINLAFAPIGFISAGQNCRCHVQGKKIGFLREGMGFPAASLRGGGGNGGSSWLYLAGKSNHHRRRRRRSEKKSKEGREGNKWGNPPQVNFVVKRNDGQTRLLKGKPDLPGDASGRISTADATSGCDRTAQMSLEPARRSDRDSWNGRLGSGTGYTWREDEA